MSESRLTSWGFPTTFLILTVVNSVGCINPTAKTFNPPPSICIQILFRGWGHPAGWNQLTSVLNSKHDRPTLMHHTSEKWPTRWLALKYGFAMLAEIYKIPLYDNVGKVQTFYQAFQLYMRRAVLNTSLYLQHLCNHALSTTLKPSVLDLRCRCYTHPRTRRPQPVRSLPEDQ